MRQGTENGTLWDRNGNNYLNVYDPSLSLRGQSVFQNGNAAAAAAAAAKKKKT